MEIYGFFYIFYIEVKVRHSNKNFCKKRNEENYFHICKSWWVNFLEISEVKWKSLSHVRLCDPMDYTAHGLLQARILEWIAFPFSRGSSQHRDQTQVSHIAGRFFTSWATREAQEYWSELYEELSQINKKNSRYRYWKMD